MRSDAHGQRISKETTRDRAPHQATDILRAYHSSAAELLAAPKLCLIFHVVDVTELIAAGDSRFISISMNTVLHICNEFMSGTSQSSRSYDAGCCLSTVYSSPFSLQLLLAYCSRMIRRALSPVRSYYLRGRYGGPSTDPAKDDGQPAHVANSVHRNSRHCSRTHSIIVHSRSNQLYSSCNQ